MNWQIKSYKDLSKEEFHDIIQLRIAVFVVEQNCPYQELDDKDRDAYHLFGQDDNGKIVAVARILPEGISYEKDWSIGRVLILPEFRNRKSGYDLMEEAIRFIRKHAPEKQIRISAQAHLQSFYEKVGFTFTGRAYDEDGIPHIEMIYPASNSLPI